MRYYVIDRLVMLLLWVIELRCRRLSLCGVVTCDMCVAVRMVYDQWRCRWLLLVRGDRQESGTLSFGAAVGAALCRGTTSAWY